MGPNTSQSVACTREVLDSVRWIVQTLRESSRRAERQVGLSGAQLFVVQKLAESPGCRSTSWPRAPTPIKLGVDRRVAAGRARAVGAANAGGDRRTTVELALTPRGQAIARKRPTPRRTG